jgi:hypothetical protein
VTALVPTLVARLGGADITASAITAGAGGDTIPAGPASYLHVKNASGSAVTVTVTPTGFGPDGVPFGPQVLTPTVPATTGDIIYGPFPANPYADSGGLVHLSYSATTSVTVQALNIPGT